MKKYPNIILGVVLALVAAVGALQGRQITRVREAESFYRWILAQSTQARIFDSHKAVSVDEKPMDRQLFEEIASIAEPLLPDIPVAKDDVDAQGNPRKKLIRMTQDESKDILVWELARSDALDQQRRDFLRYLREKKISNVGSEFDPNAVYGEGGASVGLSNVFLGFRKIAANFVWLQVDRYWHQGAMHRMVPLMRTCVTLDPTFVDAYLLGAWHLAYNMTAHLMDTPEPLKVFEPKYGVRVGEKERLYYNGADFLKDGIRKNPRDYRPYFDLGYSIYNIKLKDYSNAVRYLSEAMKLRHDRWVPRMLNICLELNGQYEEALDGWKRFYEANPDNLTAPRFIPRNEGLMKEKKAEQLMAKAKETQDPAEAEALKAEANKLKQEAMAIWQDMIQKYEEPFAVGRVMRRKALDLIDEGRPVEAIAVLENARWKSADFWDEASQLIIDTKLKANLPLSVSEKKAVLRKEEAEQYKKAAEEGNQAPAASTVSP